MKLAFERRFSNQPQRSNKWIIGLDYYWFYEKLPEIQFIIANEVDMNFFFDWSAWIIFNVFIFSQIYL